MSYGRLSALLLTVALPIAGPVPVSAQAIGSSQQQLLYVALNVADVDRSRQFYTTVVGLKELPAGGPSAKPRASAMLSFSGTLNESFLMLNQAGPTGALKSGGTLQRLVFKVLDAKAVVARARASGAAIKSEAAPAHGIKTLTVGVILDPDGNEIELVQTTTG